MATAVTHEAIERAGQVEVRGTDYIPDDERQGHPRALFWVWMSCNVTYLYFVIGGSLMLLGLSLWEALAISVAGNIWWLLIGWLATSGPAAGTPTVIIMRSMFGVRGNKVFGAGLGVLIGLFYEIVNIALATMASWALLDHLGIATTDVVKWASLVIVTLASFVISVFGHATILKLSPIFTAILAVCFIALAAFVLGAADFNYTTEALPPADHFAMIMLGLVIVASNPISWGTSADYARYLPKNTSKRGVVLYTALGSAIPAILITALGAIAGTAIDMTDPQIALKAIVPGWFYAVFLGLIVLSSITNNVLVAYSTGLYFQELSARTKRWATVVITGAAAFVASAWLLFAAPSFIDTLNASLELGVTIMCPLVTVYGLDIWLRKGRYDGLELYRTDRESKFWYSAGIYWPGMIAMVVSTAVAVMSADTTLYVGPISEALAGADLSAFVAPVLAAAIYVTLWHNTHPYNKVEMRPVA